MAERFVEDLKASVAFVKENPGWQGAMGPIYGMANTIPDRGLVADALKDYMDGYYRIR